ncbi:MAG: ChrB protein [Deltaproteobacteria bacterium]|nr:MAG: ChrB protein [Deltaproteobacteria bacterium]
MAPPDLKKWLLLIHQIPPKPDYFRVKIWRRLRKVGAVAIKQSVYVLPENESTREDLSWIVKEIDDGGGTASLCRAGFIEGLSDRQIKALFQAARNEDYKEIIRETRRLLDLLKADEFSKEDVFKNRAKLSRQRHRFEEVREIDFFQASGQKTARQTLRALESMLKRVHGRPVTLPVNRQEKGRTWVTRTGVYIDRIACVWLIRRFIDRDARFKFVSPDGYHPRPGEYRFDMFAAEFSHEGDLCTFEVLVRRFCLALPAVCAVAEIIHDIDLKDNKFDRPEAHGIQALFSGLATAHTDDETRVDRGTGILDELYAYFKARCSSELKDGSSIESVNLNPPKKRKSNATH